MSTVERTSVVRHLVRALAFLGATAFFAISSYAAPTVTVIAPKGGTSAGSPVFYEAYATSAACTKGIAAMRIYTADHVAAYTVNGAHLETFIKLAPGTYNTVVQAWDNCGGVSKTPITLTVTSTAGVSVFLPNTASSSHPVHIAASAQNSACAAGINAIRIYTADGVSPYTVNSNQLDTYLTLVPGTYKLTVQAWDNCGHVYKSQFNQPVTTTPDAYLYAVNAPPNAASDIYQFKIASNGFLKNPNGQNALPEFAAGSGPGTLVVDPGGWFVYASTVEGIYGYQINQANGNLVPMQGSPFPLNDTNNIVPPWLGIDPSGNFLFARYNRELNPGNLTSYRINRSSGALTSTGFTVATTLDSFAFDFSGQYLYDIDVAGVDGWRINPNTGFLAALPGSPFPSDSLAKMYQSILCSTGGYLYAGGKDNSGNGQDGAIVSFSINYSTGALTELPSSPLITHDWQPWKVLADTQTRFIWSWQVGLNRGIVAYDITPGTGDLTASAFFSETDPDVVNDWVEDHSGKYVFTGYVGWDFLNGKPGASSWPISGNGDLLSQTIFFTQNPIGSVAVARQNPN
jgi:6-phosphogluconolactonase (cycloisomerase 2 family)